ncbi:MAG: hypothetical protein O3C57_02590 [Verrucomicrobia bacterium]|nr:hypothetical protein [Verrucomicrobiota bacterium]
MIAINRHEALWNAAGYWRYSGDWVHYFKANASVLMEIPWHLEETLGVKEKAAIGHSIAIFQLGESSDGEHFIAAGKEYVTASGDTHYEEALKRFIAEEHRHSRDLGHFMRTRDIPFLQHQWTDFVFRCIRKAAGLEVCISVLITAELVAKTYYQALHEATGSRILKTLCRQICRDEVQHVYFQSGVLGRIRQGRSLGRLWVNEQLHGILMLGTLGVVWLDHRHVYRAGGFSFRRYARETWAELRASLRICRSWAILGDDAQHFAPNAQWPALIRPEQVPEGRVGSAL